MSLNATAMSRRFSAALLMAVMSLKWQDWSIKTSLDHGVGVLLWQNIDAPSRLISFCLHPCDSDIALCGLTDIS